MSDTDRSPVPKCTFDYRTTLIKSNQTTKRKKCVLSLSTRLPPPHFIPRTEDNKVSYLLSLFGRWLVAVTTADAATYPVTNIVDNEKKNGEKSAVRRVAAIPSVSYRLRIHFIQTS